jgi:hypothetical protein
MNIEKLIKIGGSEWKKNGMHRIYFNIDMMVPLYGLELSFYGTGNVSSAKLNGEKISNSEATRLLRKLDSKIHYDVIDKKWRASGTGAEFLSEIVTVIKEKAGI